MPVITPASDRAQFLQKQNWESYTAEEHDVWKTLFHRQAEILKDRAAPEFLDGLHALDVTADGIPDFRRLNDILGPATGWEIVAVKGLVPDDMFFELLANRKFPSTSFIRTRQQLDYLQEPDIFHDIFGHVPLLTNPVFADYMQAYGQGGVKAMGHGALDKLSRLYWYTVEFGLIDTPDGLRIYGAGILSSKGESVWSLEDPSPNRLGFDLKRIMRTRYRIDDYQETYFVIDSYDQLFEQTRPDFAPLYAELAALPDLEPREVLPGDRVFNCGTGVYHDAKRVQAAPAAE